MRVLAACAWPQGRDYTAATSFLVLLHRQVHDAGLKLNPFTVPLLTHWPQPGAMGGSRPDGPVRGAPCGKELCSLLGLALQTLCFVLWLLSLQLVFKTDAALSRVLPNPLSPAGYFPSGAIYLSPFIQEASVSHLSSPPTWEGLQPSLPSTITWGQILSEEHTDLLVRRGSPGGSVEGLGGLLHCN